LLVRSLAFLSSTIAFPYGATFQPQATHPIEADTILVCCHEGKQGRVRLAFDVEHRDRYGRLLA